MLKKLIEPTEKGHKKKPNTILFILLALGVLIMLISNMITSSSLNEENSSPVFDTPTDSEEDAEETFGKQSYKPTSISDYEDYYENQLRDILADAIGIDAVSVKVNIASTEKKIFEKNRRTENQVTEETDREGGKRTIESETTDEEVIIIQDGSEEVPVIIGTEKPLVTGVIVVAQGAENIQTKQRIIESVTRFLDLPSHKVSVLPKKFKEE